MADEGLSGASAAPAAATRSRALPAHLFGILFVFLAFATALAGMVPSPAVPANAPPEQFSAERAMAHVRELAKKPHPVGSVGHDAARDTVLARLRELGLEPEVQKTFTTQKFFGRTSGAMLENIVARVGAKGADHRALLFAAHYDAVPQSPGAGDDGSGTAALLEAARAITQGPPLDRDIVFLFTDGEELGLLGANAFVSEHAAMKDVIAAFNFDARGSYGSVAMFDVSEQNGALIAALSGLGRVQASSFVSSLAKVMPNDTDATIFKKASIPTMSFAFADGVVNYHRATDAPDRLDPRSVQQMGEAIVSLARVLGRGPVPSLEAPDVAYFTFFGRALVRLPLASVTLLALIVCAIVLAATGVATKRREEVTTRGVVTGALVALLGSVIAVLAALGVAMLVGRIVVFDALMVRPVAGALVALATTTLFLAAVMRFAAKRFGEDNIALGALSMISIIVAVASIIVPAAAFPFALASVAATLPAVGGAIRSTRVTALVAPVLGYVLAGALVLVALPTLYSISIAAAATAAVPASVFALPFLLWLAPWLVRARGKRMLYVLGGTVAIALVALVRLWLPLGAEVPNRSTLAYGVDADRKQGFFFGSQPQPWMGAVLKAEGATRRSVAELTLFDSEYWVGPPEVAGLEGVTVERPERKRLADMFEIHATFKPSKDARCFSVWDESKTIIDVASVNDKAVRTLIRFSPEKDEALMQRLRLGGLRPAFYFQFCGMAGAPVTVVFHTKSEAEVPVRVVETKDGTPPAPGGGVLKRPEGEIPTEDSDRTVIGKTVRL